MTILRPCSTTSTMRSGTAQQNQLDIASCSARVPTPAACSTDHAARNVTNANVTV